MRTIEAECATVPAGTGGAVGHREVAKRHVFENEIAQRGRHNGDEVVSSEVQVPQFTETPERRRDGTGQATVRHVEMLSPQQQ